MAPEGYFRGVTPRAIKVDLAVASTTTPPASERPPDRIVIQYPQPAVDDGRYAAKRVVGDTVGVSADIFRDGHELLRAVARYRAPGSRRWSETELARIDARLDGVRWAGTFVVENPGRWVYTVEAWTDRFGTWREELGRKVAAGQHDLGGEISEGILLLRETAERARTTTLKTLIERSLQAIEDENVSESTKYDIALDPALYDAVQREQERHEATAPVRLLV
jgi:starch synthase (maltosyl-transferring)